MISLKEILKKIIIIILYIEIRTLLLIEILNIIRLMKKIIFNIMIIAFYYSLKYFTICKCRI